MQDFKERVNELTVEFIRQDKEEKGITNHALAEAMDISDEVTCRYLTGSIKMPMWFVVAYFNYIHADASTITRYYGLVSEVAL